MELISFGNFLFLEYFDTSPLVSTEEQPYAIGKKAVETLIEIINNKGGMQKFQNTEMECNLIIH